LRARLSKIVLVVVVVLVLEKARSSQRVGVIARPILCTARYRSTTPPVDQTFEDEDDDEYEDDFPEPRPTKGRSRRSRSFPLVPGIPGIAGVPILWLDLS
jgi:hypothetical protein